MMMSLGSKTKNKKHYEIKKTNRKAGNKDTYVK